MKLVRRKGAEFNFMLEWMRELIRTSATINPDTFHNRSKSAVVEFRFTPNSFLQGVYVP